MSYKNIMKQKEVPAFQLFYYTKIKIQTNSHHTWIEAASQHNISQIDGKDEVVENEFSEKPAHSAIQGPYLMADCVARCARLQSPWLGRSLVPPHWSVGHFPYVGLTQFCLVCINR